MPGALMSYLAPAMGVHTFVFEKEENVNTIVGQFIHLMGSQFARLTFLSPDEFLDSPGAIILLDHMAVKSGQNGALRLLADVDEHSLAFDALRRDSFSIFTRQRIWLLTSRVSAKSQSKHWRSAGSQDALAIKLLYNNLVPGLVQQVEPFDATRRKGVVYYQGGDLLAFVELKYGHRGIWAQPFIHPDMPDLANQFVEQMTNIPNRRSRPLYICVRSYQSWLETAIEDLGVESGPNQAVMVRHLAIPKKAVRTFTMPAIEGGQPEITTPITRMEN